MADYITGRESSSSVGLWVAGGIVALLVVIFSLVAMGGGGTTPADPAYAPAGADPVDTAPAVAPELETPAPVVQ